MREFLEGHTTTDGTLRVTASATYVEYEFPLPIAGAMISYLTVEDERFRLWTAGTPTACSFTAQACVNQTLSPYASLMQDSVHGDQWTEVFFQSFPVLDELYRDSATDRLDNGGLRWVDDPDVSESKYMIVVAIDDVPWDGDNYLNLFQIEPIRLGLVRALERSLALANDLEDHTVGQFTRAIDEGLLGPDPQEVTGAARLKSITDAMSKVKDWSDFLGNLRLGK